MDGTQPLDPSLIPAIEPISVTLPVETMPHPRFERPLQAGVREARLLGAPPWVRSLGKLTMEVKTEGWRFPAPPKETPVPGKPRLFQVTEVTSERETAIAGRLTRVKPPADTVFFKDRLLYLLQPPLESLFAGKQV